jgi:hypothetical protein
MQRLMRTARPASVFASVVVILALLAAVALAAGAQKITASGVGKVKLHAAYTQLRAQHLVGKLGKGCPLVVPNAPSASLSAPLKGLVDFTASSPHKVADITVRGGAKARGVGIGATLADIKAKFAHVKVDHSGEKTFGITFVSVPPSSGGKLQFGIDVKTHKVTLIGIPFIATCE